MRESAELVDTPPSDMDPATLAQRARALLGKGVKIREIVGDDLLAAKLGGIHAVGRAASQPARMLVATIGKGSPHVALVGKGISFDTGGLHIKARGMMETMKADMGGAAALLGAFRVLHAEGVAHQLSLVLCIAENAVDARSYKPDDILTMHSGKTVEINNTDAEGRLTLADAMVYGSRLEPDFMIDFATLTGACMVALGPKIAGVMAKDDALAEDWLAASTRSGESMWRLPLPDDLKEQLKSKFADMKNTGERWGGALTAGLFLSEFTEGRRWLHVDIAGPAMASKAYGVTTPGGTGFPVATIIEFLSGDVRLSAP
jgi:leucyl aminopeptidase